MFRGDIGDPYIASVCEDQGVGGKAPEDTVLPNLPLEGILPDLVYL